MDIALFDSVLSTLSMPVGILQATGQKPRASATITRRSRRTKCCTSDGMVMIAAANRRLWKQLCAARRRAAAGRGPAIQDEHGPRGNRRRSSRSSKRRSRRSPSMRSSIALQQIGVACGRVRTMPEALEDPQIEPRQMLIPFDDPELGGFRVIGNPIKLSDTPRLNRRPPKLGEHTTEILAELEAKAMTRE